MYIEPKPEINNGHVGRKFMNRSKKSKKMAASEEALKSLQDLLVQSISSDNTLRKQSEQYIATIESQSGFLITLLQLINRLSTSTLPSDYAIRQSGAVLFKNVIKKRWVPDEDSQDSPIVYTDRDMIKTHLIDVMCSASSDVQKQLAEAVSLIAKYEFPMNWSNLLPQLVNKLGNTNDINIKKGVMITVNSITKRYRYTYKSDTLFAEIKECLIGFQVPLLETYKSNLQYIDTLTTTTSTAGTSGATKDNNIQLLIIAIETQRLMTRIFFSLNWQDLPEYFEDHISEWMSAFAHFLSYKNPTLAGSRTQGPTQTRDTESETEPGPIESLQTAIIENLNLYATKYEEEFMPYLAPFTQVYISVLIV